MLTLTIPDPLARDLEAVAADAGRPVMDVAREALARYLEDAEDIALARAALHDIERGADVPIPLQEYLSRDLDG